MKRVLCPRSLIIGATVVAILAVGYLLDHQAEPATPRVVPLSPAAPSAKARRALKSSKPAQEQGDRGSDKAAAADSVQPLRDPFRLKPRRTDHSGKQLRLEELELSQLRLVAIVRDVEGRFGASVEDSSGLGFMLREGTRIGSGSLVSSISSDEVVVQEAGRSEHRLRLRAAAVLAESSASTTAPRSRFAAARAQNQLLP